jgi:hypothetical protein
MAGRVQGASRSAKRRRPLSHPPERVNAMWVSRPTCYHPATPRLAKLARREAIYKTERFSDHAPLTAGYGLAP